MKKVKLSKFRVMIRLVLKIADNTDDSSKNTVLSLLRRLGVKDSAEVKCKAGSEKEMAHIKNSLKLTHFTQGLYTNTKLLSYRDLVTTTHSAS